MASDETSLLSVPYVTPGAMYAVSIVLPFLGIVFVLLRFYARALQKKPSGLDDWLMLLALILVIGMGICLIIGVQRKAIAYSTPLYEDLTPEEQLTNGNPATTTLGVIQYAFVILMVLAFGMIKLSITFYYRRIFVIAKGLWFDWITKAALAIVVLWTVACLFGFIFSCGTHIFSDWSSALDNVLYCGPSVRIENAFAVSDLITDVMVLCLPLPVIWCLQMRMGEKLVVTAILATGAASTVASIIKVILSFEIPKVKSSARFDSQLVLSTALYWPMIEGGLAVIAGCLPTLSFLVRKVSFSSILHSVRSALRFGSVHTQQRQQRFQGSLPHSQESYAYIHADSSTLLNSDAVGEKSKDSIDMLVMGRVSGLSEPQEHGIQVTRQFSQDTSMV